MGFLVNSPDYLLGSVICVAILRFTGYKRCIGGIGSYSDRYHIDLKVFRFNAAEVIQHTVFIIAAVRSYCRIIRLAVICKSFVFDREACRHTDTVFIFDGIVEENKVAIDLRCIFGTALGLAPVGNISDDFFRNFGTGHEVCRELLLAGVVCAS